MISRSWLVPGDRHGRKRVAALCVVALVVTAGCTGLLTDDNDADDEDDDLVAQVPANATALAQLDPTAIDGDDHLLADLTELTADRAAVESELLTVEDRTGLDPLSADAVLLFETSAEEPTDTETSGDESQAVLVDGDWTEDEVVDSVESTTGVEYEQADRDALYRPVEEPDEPIAIGVHDDGRYVVGDEAAVTASLAVGDGDAEAVSGSLPVALEDGDGPLSVAELQSDSIVPEEFAAEAPSFVLEAFDDVDVVVRSYASAEEGLSIGVGLYASDEETATNVEDVTPGALAFLAESSLTDEAAADAVDEIAIDRDGQTVWLTYTGDTDAVFDLLEEV